MCWEVQIANQDAQVNTKSSVLTGLRKYYYLLLCRRYYSILLAKPLIDLEISVLEITHTNTFNQGICCIIKD